MRPQTKPPILEGCDVLPPMHQGNASTGRHQGDTAKKAKRKPDRRDTAGRFAVLNAFVDFTLQGLSRAEALTWLVLWRDTKPDGTAHTSQTDIARRIGANLSTVKRAVAALVKADLLAVVYRGSLRRGPSAYRVRPLARESTSPTRPPPKR